jgi:hypothetical protein
MEASEDDKLTEEEVLGQVLLSAYGDMSLNPSPNRWGMCLSARRLLQLLDVFSISSLIFAATDTTSNALSRIIHLLASHQEVQDRLRQEIIGVLHAKGGQDFSYDELVSLPFLDAICRETLRLWVRRLILSFF